MHAPFIFYLSNKNEKEALIKSARMNGEKIQCRKRLNYALNFPSDIEDAFIQSFLKYFFA